LDEIWEFSFHKGRERNHETENPPTILSTEGKRKKGPISRNTDIKGNGQAKKKGKKVARSIERERR